MKQIKTFTLALAAALLLLATGCTDERDNGGTGNIAPGTPVEINFDAPTVANNGTATRAATTVPLPANTTVRITPYNKTKSRYESSLTYYVGTPADGKGKLIPYTSQNADGTFVTGTKMKVIMGDTYLFYISTPAKDITSEGYKQTVGNNEDYASAVSGDVLITGNFVTNAFCPTLPTLVRRCAQITVELMPASMQIASAPGGVKLSGLRSAQAGIAPGAAIPTTGGTYDQSYTVTTLQSENVGKLLYNSFCVLPGVSTATITAQLVAILKPDGVNEVRKTVTYSAKFNFPEPLKPGYRYQVRLVAETENAEVLPTVTVTDWEDAGAIALSYPYVIANAEGKKCIIVTKDIHGQGTATELFGGVPENYILHEPWLETPSFHGTMSELATISGLSPIFEVAQTDAATERELYGTTNGSCLLPWRRPTIFELRLIDRMRSADRLEVERINSNYYFAAEKMGDAAVWVSDIGYPDNTIEDNFETIGMTTKGYTRCVRDFGIVSPNYAHVKDGKFIISQDEYGTTAGTFHPKWGSNDVPLHEENTPNDAVSARFEVSNAYSGDPTFYYWQEAQAYCAAYAEKGDKSDVGQWRLPTKKEGTLIYKLKNNLTLTTPFDNVVNMIVASRPVGFSTSNISLVAVWEGDGDLKFYKSGQAEVRCVRDY